MGRQKQVQLDDHKVIIMDLKARVEALEKTVAAAHKKPKPVEPNRETRAKVRGAARAGSDKLRDEVAKVAADVREEPPKPWVKPPRTSER